MKNIKFHARRGAACLALAAAAFFFCGAYSGDQERVEITYTVEPGDCLWSIGEKHMPLNTGGRRYLPEFIEGIKELNPWIKENGYVLHAGDKVRISYWIKKEQEQ